MELILSILRRILFIGIIILLALGRKITLTHFVIAYIIIIVLSYLYYYFLYKKYPNLKYPFISRIWRVDICDPIIKHSQKNYRIGSRLGGLWDHRNQKHSSFKEAVKSFFVRIIVYLIVIFIIYIVIYSFAK